MSNLVVPNDSKAAMIKRLTGLSTDIANSLGLIRADFPVSPATGNADFQEATFTGYSRASLLAPVMAFDPVTSRYVVTWNPKTWTKNGAVGDTIYGYFVRFVPGEELWWFEKFDAPISMSNDGAFITLTPRLSLASQFVNGP